MYNYTIKAYKAVKSTLKTQIEVLSKASVHIRAYTRTAQEVYKCTIEAIHLSHP